MDGKNIGVIGRGGGACFLFKAAQTICVTGENWRQDFECDFTPENSITSAVDFSHTACAHHFHDRVRSQFCARTEGHYRHRGLFQESAASMLMRGKQGFDFLKQVWVRGTGLCEKGRTRIGRKFEDSIQKLVNFVPGFRLHGQDLSGAFAGTSRLWRWPTGASRWQAKSPGLQTPRQSTSPQRNAVRPGGFVADQPLGGWSMRRRAPAGLHPVVGE